MGFLILYAAVTLVMLLYGMLNPDRLTTSLLFFTIGLLGTWRHYVRWRRQAA